MLFFLTPALSASTKRSAMQFMIDHALEDEEFYRWALENKVIRITRKVGADGSSA